jgi:precorrin isomerase
MLCRLPAASVDPLVIDLTRIVADFTDATIDKIKADGHCAVDVEAVRSKLNGPLRAAIRAVDDAEASKAAEEIERAS